MLAAPVSGLSEASEGSAESPDRRPFGQHRQVHLGLATRSIRATAPPTSASGADGPGVMRVQHLGDTAGEPLAGGNVEKLVGAVGVGLGPQDSGDEELGIRRTSHRAFP